MNKTLQSRLFRRFPKLYREHKLPVKKSCMGWGITCDDGWFDLIWNLSEMLERRTKAVPNLRAAQVKEKFGTLRFYIHDGDDEAKRLCHAAEDASMFICEDCGRAGKPRTIRNWKYTACDTCAKRTEKRFAKFK